MNVQQAKEIRIDSFLECLGFTPDHTNRQGTWFKSPLRSGEKTASFKVTPDGKVWKDHATDEWGMIIEFAQEYFRLGSDVGSALREIESVVGATSSTPTDLPLVNQPLFHRSTHNVPKTDGNEIKINNTRELKNFRLLEYLNSRGIDTDIGKKFCVEIYASLKGNAFYSIGFKNRSGGYALRNKLYKQAVSPAEISIVELLGKNQIANEKEKLPCMLFEGFFDFLSYVQMRRNGTLQKSPVIAVVLNSLSHLEKGIETIQEQNFCDIFSYLDNNEAGRAGQNALQDAFKGGTVRVFDEMESYSQEDLNDVLRAL